MPGLIFWGVFVPFLIHFLTQVKFSCLQKLLLLLLEQIGEIIVHFPKHCIAPGGRSCSPRLLL